MVLINSFQEVIALQDTDWFLIERPGAESQYFKVSLATLKGLFGTSNVPSRQSTLLNFQSDGDNQGVFYFLGKKGRADWANPLLAGEIAITIFSPYDTNHNNPAYLCDRQPNSAIATSNQPGSYYLIDLKNYRLKINHYSLRARDYHANNPSNWQLQGSDDLQAWLALDSQVNRNLQQNQWFNSAVQAVEAKRYFRIISTGASSSGDNIFCIAELELYGELINAL